MNRRAWLGMLAGLLGLSATRRAESETEPADFWSPKLISKDWTKTDPWLRTNSLKFTTDGFEGQLLQLFVHVETGAVEWRPVRIEMEARL